MTRTRLGLVGRGLGLGIGLGTLGLGLGSQDMRLATRPIVECVSHLHIIFATEHVRRAISHGFPGRLYTCCSPGAVIGYQTH